MNDETSIKETLVKIKDLYEGNLSQHGVSSKAVGWKDQESQLLRFEKLAEVIPENTDSYTVADWGCGYAAMYDFLREKKPGCRKFYGYDISADMLHKARELHPGDELELIQSADVTTNADYTFVSGTFNVRLKASEDEWKAFILAKLDEINRYSGRGFAFNLLSTYVDWKEPHLFYGDPLFWFDHCKRTYSPKVSLLHDYPLYEWTIVVRK